MSFLDDVLEAYTFADLIAEFNLAPPRGREWRCPFPEGHNNADATPSATITRGRDGQEIYRCYTCDRWGSAVNVYSELLGITFKEALQRCGTLKGLAHYRFEPVQIPARTADHLVRQRLTPTKPKAPLGTLVKTYDYHDEYWRLLFQVCRFEPKDFRQRRPNGDGGWEWDMRGVRRVLYRLPQIVQARRGGKAIWVCEGEKDADALVELGYCATTNPGGANKWLDSYSETLLGADVVVVRDNDPAGEAHAELLREKLAPVVKEMWVVAPTSAKDVAEMLAQGLPVTALREVS